MYTFDINKWFSKFPVNNFDYDAIGSVHGPEYVCVIEQIRRGIPKAVLGPAVPTDIFILAYGEPKDHTVTKFGGAAAWPASRPWPTSDETGDALTFVGQFCFAESRDILPELPGGLLLAFFEDEAVAPYDYFPGPPVFVWSSGDIESPEIKHPQSKPAFEFPNCFGYRYRTVDYPAAGDISSFIPSNCADPKIFDTERTSPDDRDSFLRQFCVWSPYPKIGGVPFWERPTEVSEQNIEPGRFIASIPGIWGDSETMWPWLNHRSEVYDGPPLNWSSGGIVHLFMNSDSEILPRFQLFS